MTVPHAPSAARPGLSKIRQTPWVFLGFVSGLVAYGAPAATQINTNGEWGWFVVLMTWAFIFPFWIVTAVLLMALPGHGTRRRRVGIGLLLGPAPLLLCTAALIYGVAPPQIRQ